MATKITEQDSMRVAATKIAGGFTELGVTPPSITEQDSMSDIARKVNAAFDAIVDSPQHITEQDSMQVIANKIDANFAAADVQPTPTVSTFSFLHASDPHGNEFGLLKETLNNDSDCEFAMISGDLKAYGSSAINYNATSLKSECNGKLMACSGNHDAWDSWDGNTTNRDNRWMSKWLYTLMGSSVNWGDTLGEGFDGAPISSYYYKDFNTNGSHPVRLITIDQFEVYKKLGINGNTYNANYRSVVVMTNKQMQWFVQLLKDTPANYTIIIALHETPFYNNSGYIESLDPLESGITEQQQVERLFMTEGKYTNGVRTSLYLSTYSEEYDNRYHKTSGNVETCGLIVNIMKAYLSKSSWVATYSDSNFPADGTTLIVNADFTNMGHEPAAFACYIFGHIHADGHTWVRKSDAAKQLMLSICRANKNVNITNYDDLKTTAPDQRINKVTIEFAHGNTPMCVHVQRIGQQQTIGGRTRDELFFYFDTNQTISHERITNWSAT